MFRNMTGHDPQVAPLLRSRGIPSGAAQPNAK
jgi:hypothetical protein